MQRSLGALAIGIAVSLVAFDARAHGDVHPRIDAITAQLAEHPDDAALHAERGRLYEVDENWAAAARDEDFAWSHGMNGDRALTFSLARSLSHTDDRARALPLLDHLLATDATNVDYRAVRARTLSSLGRDREAATEYAAVTAQANPLPPEYAIEYARLLARSSPPDPQGALGVLGDAMNRLGPLVAVVDAAVDIARSAGDPEAALAWIARLPPALRGTASWRLVEGDLHRQMHREDRAVNAWREGLRWMDALPTARRGSSEMVRVRGQLEQRLAGPVVVRTKPRVQWWMVGLLVALAGLTLLLPLRRS